MLYEHESLNTDHAVSFPWSTYATHRRWGC